jgi:aminoglycoside phosphotransferase (APT) family kinase protein
VDGPADQTGAATRDELLAWVGQTVGGRVTHWQEIAGGNRCRSWAVDVAPPGGDAVPLYLRYQPPRPPSAEPYTVWREAEFYRVLAGSAVPAPRMLAVHPTHQAILTERVAGRADYRRIADPAQRATIAREFVVALATLHQLPLEGRDLPGLTPGASIAACLRGELAIWRAMYAEAGRADALIDLALAWLDGTVPNPPGQPVLVHGDAGPGNFLFDAGHLTALLDWELAHAGDPMEDLAWFSMRGVMEPVPDFAGLVAEYGRLMGAPADLARIRYHRVFVSTRVVIIRHRNVTGQPGNSIVSRALNRRLLVAALADATDIALASEAPTVAPPTERTPLYDGVIDDLRHEIAGGSADARVVAAAKNAAKVVKYLRDVDRLGGLVAARDRQALADLLGAPPADPQGGQAALLQAMRAGRVPFADVLRFFAGSTAREAELAASASGGLAHRGFPELTHEDASHG